MHQDNIVTIAVSETIKGAARPEVVLKIPGGIIPGPPQFRLEDNLLLFLNEREDGLHLTSWRTGIIPSDRNTLWIGDRPLDDVIQEIRYILY